MLWVVLPLLTGLALGRAGEFLPATWLLGGAATLAGIAWVSLGRSWPGWAVAVCGAMILAGMASYALQRPRIAAWDELPPREAELALRITRTFALKDDRRVSGLAVIEQAAPHLHELAGQRVYFSLALRAGEPAPVRSTVVQALGVLATLPRDPPADTFDGYLANAGINFRFTRGQIGETLQPASAYRRFCARMMTHFSTTLGTGVEAKRPELTGVLRAMLLGQQSELTEEQGRMFRVSGTMHVFSISGLHIAVIAGGLHALLILLRLPSLARLMIELTALWLYVDITGTVPSAVRAFLMVALLMSSFALRVPGNPVSALTVSTLVVLLVDPLQMFNASFQMSYGIVAALLLVGLPLAARWEAVWPQFALLPKPAWRWHHHGRAWLWRWTLVAVAIGVAAALVSAVTGVLFFQLFTPGALLANLLVIPASSLAILAGFASLLCGLVGFTTGSMLANHAAVLILLAIEHGIRGFVHLPAMWFGATFKAPWMGGITLGALLATMIAGYAQGWRGWHRYFWAPFAVVTLGFVLGVRFE